jgi:hypothetical protein
MNLIQIAAVFLIAISVSLPAIYVVKFYVLKQFKKKAVLTKALITHSEKRISYNGRHCYQLWIQYKLAGKEIFYMAQTHTEKKYNKGEYLPLMYLENKPQEFETNFNKNLGWMMVFSFFLLSAIAIPCYLLLNN